jgi:hypothetical protein
LDAPPIIPAAETVEDIAFNSNIFSLVDRGVVYAVAHIRGGGEMGKAWHDDGRMMHKKNTFTDFIACAEYLVTQGYGSKDKLVIAEGSAGGLLMGAVTNMRPDLFKAVVSHVPFVDIINTMLDESLPLTVPEFEEWGNPKQKADAAEQRWLWLPRIRSVRQNSPAVQSAAVFFGLSESRCTGFESDISDARVESGSALGCHPSSPTTLGPSESRASPRSLEPEFVS